MPHLKELVKLHADSPFVVVGVNTGDKPDAFRAGLEEHDLPWISAYQGEESPITNLYQVRSFPTYYLIDGRGRVVYKGHDTKAAANSIDRLVKETVR